MRAAAVVIVLLLFTAIVACAPLQAQSVIPSTTEAFVRNAHLGLAHVSAPDGGTAAERYITALSLGASWNRFPLYWDRIETSPGNFQWSAYDRQIADDLQFDLQINAILLGRPGFYADGERITGMHTPIFADGTDTPAADKPLNPDNPWARYVFETVNRYKPDGAAAAAGMLPPGVGIRVWEIWNEPDVKLFWSASIGDYARLLKVAYLSAKQADPNAQIMFAGLLFGTEDNWLARVLAIFEQDPQREAHNWYMDIVAIHAYADPWRTGWLVLNVKQSLIAYGLTRPIWVTETGVPVWDDYPGPTWASDPAQHQLRATQIQQAWYVIQSAVYGWHEGADVLIFHQLYDDCGDQPAGTDFPPHNGTLCAAGMLCSGDAHGLFRNVRSSVCFSQHPVPGSPRPSATAYLLLAQVFDSGFTPLPDITLSAEQVSTGQPLGVFAAAFEMADGRRITAYWNRTATATTIAVDAAGFNAQRVMLDGDELLAPDENGQYRLVLPPAMPDGYPELQPGADSAIGGAPVLVIERPEGVVDLVRFQRSLGPVGVPVVSVPQAPTTPTPIPTIDPANDTTAPLAFMRPLPDSSPTTFTVAWGGADNSGIDLYLVWVRVDGGDWAPWLETEATGATYQGEPGRRYEFDVWARDLAGNWTSRTEMVAQTATTVE